MTPPVAPKIQHIPAAHGRDPILSAFRRDGAVIIKNLFPADQITRFNSDIQPHMDKMSPGSRHSQPWVKDFYGAATKRLNRVVSISGTFRHEMLENELIHDLCSEIFVEEAGGYWMNSAQVVDIGPGSKAQPLHRDQWQFPVFTHGGPSAPHASVNFVVALSRFTDENGATRVLPGSHVWEDMADSGREEDTIPAEMDVGDACFISGKVIHGGGANRTEGETRRGMTMVFQCSYLTPEEAYPFILSKEVAGTMTERGQRMVGFRSQRLINSPGVWKTDYGEEEEAYC